MAVVLFLFSYIVQMSLRNLTLEQEIFNFNLAHANETRKATSYEDKRIMNSQLFIKNVLFFFPF